MPEEEKSQVQAIYFMAPKWNVSSAKKWLKEHKFEPIKHVHRKGSELRYRIREPEPYDHFTTHKTDEDVYLVMGWKK